MRGVKGGGESLGWEVVCGYKGKRSKGRVVVVKGLDGRWGGGEVKCGVLEGLELKWDGGIGEGERGGYWG